MAVDKKLFTLKTLTRVAPMYREKLKDPNYYKNKNWSHAESLKQNDALNKRLSAILFEF